MSKNERHIVIHTSGIFCLVHLSVEAALADQIRLSDVLEAVQDQLLSAETGWEGLNSSQIILYGVERLYMSCCCQLRRGGWDDLHSCQIIVYGVERLYRSCCSQISPDGMASVLVQ